MDWQPYSEVIGVSIATVTLYYAFLVRLMFVKIGLHREHTARGEKFDRYQSRDRRLLAADRAQLNMLEHMPPFLALLWLNAVFVSPRSATVAGGIYVAARVAWPLVVGGRIGRAIPVRVLLATVPGYLVLTYFCGALLAQLF